MRRPTLCFVVCSLLIGMCADVWAIAVSDYGVAENSPTNAGYALDFDYVYEYKNASSAAVDHYWILTAAHVGDDGGTGALVIDGETYTQQEVVFHTDADIALVRYDKALPDYYFLMEEDIFHKEGNGWFGTTTVWHELIMAGFGYDGTVSSSSFTQGSIRGIRRWGTNRGESESTINADVGGTAGQRSSSCFLVDFDLNDTDYEAGGNVYDSGGAVFATNGLGDWVLAGINVYRTGSDPNWTGNYAVKVADYVSWIKSVIVDYDSDKDFLPDWWETQYGGDATSMDAQADLDSDGFSNYEEWMADTDPTVGTSHFEVLEWNAPTNVVFISSTNRLYSFEYKLDLADASEAWMPEVDWFAGSDGQSETSLPNPASNRIYRIRARLR